MVNLDEMKAAALARLKKAEAALSDEDREEIAARDEIAQIQEQAEGAERKRKELDLDRRLAAARAALGEGVAIEGFVAEGGFPDTFIVRRDGRAYATWLSAKKSQNNGKKIDDVEVDRTLARTCVYDWNGYTDFDTNSDRTSQLSKYLKDNPGLVTPLTNAVAKLAGVFAESRKS